MPSASDQPSATSSASQRDRTRGATLPGGLGLAALLSVLALALALAGPAAAATRSGGPSPDPSPTATGSGGPSPDPVPQATGAGGITSQPSVGTGSTSPSSGTPSSSTTIPLPYTVPAAPQVSRSGASTASNHTSSGPGTDQADSAARATTAAVNRAPHTRKPHNHAVAHPTAGQREAALAYQQLRHQLALESRTAGPISAAAATITSAPAHNSGTVLLIGAAVLFLLAAAGGTLLRRLWRLHGQWYGGKPA